MEEQFDYRGHRILVSAFNNGDRFGWEFRIDGGKLVSLRASPAMDEPSARAEAQAAARSVVDLRDGSVSLAPQ